jgi:hypothetical protein
VPGVLGRVGAVGVCPVADGSRALGGAGGVAAAAGEVPGSWGTHALLPDLCLLRRQYETGLIGAAIEAKARGR